MPLPADSVGEGTTVSGCNVCSFVHLSSQILLPQYVMNYLSNLDETDGEYLLALNADLIRFWRSKVKVIAGLSLWWKRRPHQRWGIIVYLLVDSAFMKMKKKKLKTGYLCCTLL